MSETNKKHVKRRFRPYLPMIALLGMLASWQPSPAGGQDLSAYGASMCAEVGIPADQCSLSAQGSPSEATAAAGDKTATLFEHGRRVCAQEGVPMEDCKALPLSYRQSEENILPAASFLTVPDSLPAVDPDLVPAPVIADAPVPAQQQGVRYVDPPVRPAEPPLRYVGPPPVEPSYRYVEPSYRYVEPSYRYVEPSYRYVEPPPLVEPPLRAFRQPPPEPAFRYVEPPALVVERPERIGRLEDFGEVGPSGRCLRAVRYSRPPSHRYVTC